MRRFRTEKDRSGTSGRVTTPDPELLTANAPTAGLENAGGETSIEPVEHALQDDPDW
jgi:hypothetical protein